MNSTHKKNIARFGIATKGVVYCVAGILTSLAVFTKSGQKSDSQSVFTFIENQPFGQILLTIVGVGLVAYAFWRFYETISSRSMDSDGRKDMLKRLGLGVSGVIYMFLAYVAFRTVTQAAGDSGSSKEKMVNQVLQMEFGQFLIILVSLIILGKGIWQIYKAVTKEFEGKIGMHKLGTRVKEFVSDMGTAGYIARGIVLVVIAYIFFRAAIEVNPSEVGGTKEAFTFIENTFGQFLLMLVAVGFVCYGAFMLVEARYRNMTFIS